VRVSAGRYMLVYQRYTSGIPTVHQRYTNGIPHSIALHRIRDYCYYDYPSCCQVEGQACGKLLELSIREINENERGGSGDYS
jgi:hypothetical protein